MKCLTRHDTLASWEAGAVVSFYIGVWLALTMGWESISSNQKMLNPHSNIIAFWEMAAIDGQLDHEEHQRIMTDSLSQFRKAKPYSMYGRFSFLVFSVGVVCLAFSLRDSQKTISTTLEQVQHGGNANARR